MEHLMGKRIVSHETFKSLVFDEETLDCNVKESITRNMCDKIGECMRFRKEQDIDTLDVTYVADIWISRDRKMMWRHCDFGGGLFQCENCNFPVNQPTTFCPDCGEYLGRRVAPPDDSLNAERIANGLEVVE